MEKSFDRIKQGGCQVAKKKIPSESGTDNVQRVTVLHTMEVELKEWLEAEKKKTGRSVSFMIELALNQWRDRIMKRRKYDD